jgi:hypothetical protein
MISTGWFVIAGIFGVLAFVSMVVLTETQERNLALFSSIIFLISFLVVVFCTVMGFKAPDKRFEASAKTPVKHISEEQIKEAVKQVLKNMTPEEKYQLIAN